MSPPEVALLEFAHHVPNWSAAGMVSRCEYCTVSIVYRPDVIMVKKLPMVAASEATAASRRP